MKRRGHVIIHRLELGQQRADADDDFNHLGYRRCPQRSSSRSRTHRLSPNARPGTRDPLPRLVLQACAPPQGFALSVPSLGGARKGESARKVFWILYVGTGEMENENGWIPHSLRGKRRQNRQAVLFFAHISFDSCSSFCGRRRVASSHHIFRIRIDDGQQPREYH